MPPKRTQITALSDEQMRRLLDESENENSSS